MSGLAAALTALALAGCGPTSKVTRGAGPTIAQAQAAPAGGKYRIAVGAIIDKTEPGSKKSLAHQLALINLHDATPEDLTSAAVLGGLRDMLSTELFSTDRFIVLERDAINDALVEQEFSHSSRAGDATRIPLGQLEGAELLLVGALTAFDAGVEGGALPIPFPISERGDFGVLKLRFARSYVAMDLRVIDVRTGRVLNTTSVEGSNRRFKLALSAFVRAGYSHVYLPGVLSYFTDTPVEQALQKMVTAAVGEIEKQAQQPTQSRIQ